MNVFYFSHNNGTAPSISQHKILFYELTVVRSGEVEYLANHKPLVVKSNDILFLPPNTVRSRRPSENIVDYFSFNFHLDPEDEPPDFPQIIEDGNSLEISHMLSACNGIRKRYSGNVQREQLSEILKFIIKQIGLNLRTDSEDSLVTQIRNYVQRHVKEKLSLKDISAVTHFSPVYCSSVFKREAGKSIINYAIDEKIAYAQKLILEDFDLKAIAEELGFSDYNYFSRIFKKRTGYSPSLYKSLFFT